MDILVSIVIPVYNTKNYIRDCIQSVLNQTFNNLELIVVDDGSTDGSGDICDEYAIQDQRVKVIHQENAGLSVARNVGLENSKGDYILFLDSDDFWRSEKDLEVLLQHQALSSPNFVFLEFNRSRYYPSKGIFENFKFFPKALENGLDTHSTFIELVKNGYVPMSACTKLLKRDFLVKNNISFIKGLFSEDTPWFLDIIMHANLGGIYYTNYYMYGNRTENNTSLTSTITEKKIHDVIFIIQSESKKIINSPYSDSFKYAVLSFLAYLYLIIQAQCSVVKTGISAETKNDIISLRWIIQNELHPKVALFNKIKRILGYSIALKLMVFYYQNKARLRLVKK